MSSKNNTVDLSTHNTLAEQLANINLSQQNVISILEGLLTSFQNNQDVIDIDILNQDGTINTITFHSISKMSADITRISNTLTQLTNLEPEKATTFVDENGEFKRILITSFNNTISGNVNSIEKVDGVKLDYSSLIYNLLYPSTCIEFKLPNDYLLVDEVYVRTFRFTDSSTFSNIYEGISYGECSILAEQSRIIGNWYTDIIKTDKRVNRYYGSFDILEIQSFNTDGTVNLLLNSTLYSDTNSINNTRELIQNDILVSSNGSAKYRIDTVDHFKNVIKVTQIAGITKIIPGINQLRYLYEQVDENRYLHIPIQSSEQSVIFLSPVNQFNGVINEYSNGYIIDTSSLIVYENNIPTNFDSYFNNKVINIGGYLEQLLSDSTIPFNKGIIPPAPIIESSFFNVIQINTHISENTSINDISKLSEEKEKLFNDITNLNSQISTINSRINIGRYRSLADRSSDESKLSSLLSLKKQYSALYKSIVNDITTKVSDEDIVNYSPKFRIRGFFPIHDPLISTDTRAQYIIKYKIEYRYCTPNTDISNATTMKYTDESGNEVHGVYSSWIEQPSATLQKIKNIDNTISWATNNTSDGDAININQVDIPIKAGESVEIRIKALTEAGYPITFTESNWSNVVRIEFPSELQNYSSVTATVDKNISDQQKIEVQEMLDEIGLTDHLSSAFKEQDKYFAHTAHNISSGYRSNEQNTISLFDYLTSLKNELSSLTSIVNKNALETTIEISDDNNETYTIQNYSTLQLYAGAYQDTVNPTDASSNGVILEKLFYLKITNNNTQSMDLFSPSPGDLNKNILQSNDKYYYPLVKLTKINDTDEQVQYNGQILYLRSKDVSNQSSGSELYILNDDTTTVDIPTVDIDTTATELQHDVMYYNSDGLKTCKLNINSKNDFIALHTNHPLVKNYISTKNINDRDLLINEFDRISQYNPYYKATKIQNAYSPKRNVEYDINDRYMIGKNSCGARLFMKFNSLQNIQVNGSSSNSIRILGTGSTNTITIPIVYQYRMSDALGNIDGITNNTATDIEYKKKIGIDMFISGSEFKFDIEVISKLKSNSITDISTIRVNQITNEINTNDNTSPTII